MLVMWHAATNLTLVTSSLDPNIVATVAVLVCCRQGRVCAARRHNYWYTCRGAMGKLSMYTSVSLYADRINQVVHDASGENIHDCSSHDSSVCWQASHYCPPAAAVGQPKYGAVARRNRFTNALPACIGGQCLSTCLSVYAAQL